MNVKNIQQNDEFSRTIQGLKDGEEARFKLGNGKSASIAQPKPQPNLHSRQLRNRQGKPVSVNTLKLLARAFVPKSQSNPQDIAQNSSQKTAQILDENSEKLAQETYENLVSLRQKFLSEAKIRCKNFFLESENAENDRLITALLPEDCFSEEIAVIASETDFSDFGLMDFNVDAENFQDFLISIFLVKSGFIKADTSLIHNAGKRKFIEEMLENWDEYFNEKTIPFAIE